MTFAPDAGGGMFAMLCCAGAAWACETAGAISAASDAAKQRPAEGIDVTHSDLRIAF